MSRTIAIGDIHGCSIALQALIDAPFPATIQIIKGEAAMTVSNESVAGKPGTWIQMAAKTPHSIEAESPVVMLLTLLK